MSTPPSPPRAYPDHFQMSRAKVTQSGSSWILRVYKKLVSAGVIDTNSLYDVDFHRIPGSENTPKRKKKVLPPVGN